MSIETAAVIERALAETDPAARARFFDELGLKQADVRPGVGLRDGLPDLLWRRVPAGSFWMGGDPLALGAWPGRSIAVTSDYWTAAYAVTVAQYAGFMHDGGYSERWRTCWTSAGWAWKQHYGLEAPMDWESPLAAERISNHPVEVTWYEAYAYARLLEALR